MSQADDSYYQHHVFFCTNQRSDGRACCEDCGAKAMRGYAKKKAKALGVAGAGRVRINSAGCLDRCDLGPVLVIYPEAVWYTYIDEEDIDEIFTEHLQNGRIVERLRLPK
ncbi:MAG TPA: (2Fe-2S) ferredoxin domain-containing protein [Chromatiales bacterium]|jgi:(2Fe-2S) ferredoxin|nr:(2Fe-2S) ferredoxin domain-containing protein [Chromatiales bacterium]